MRVPINFTEMGEAQIGNMGEANGESGLALASRADQTNLPEEFRYDVAPKPVGRVAPVYPYELLREGVKGNASVRFVIGETGRIVDANAFNASSREFGAAAVAMVEQWEFEPALRDGRPTKSQFGFDQEFLPQDSDIVAKRAEELLALERKHSELIVAEEKLDAAIKTLPSRRVFFPASAHPKTQGAAVVELLVDIDGRAWLPRVVSASYAAFGCAAVQAARDLTFEPPTKGGKPVVARVRVPIEFADMPGVTEWKK